jgi:prophage tail gpP-like protein
MPIDWKSPNATNVVVEIDGVVFDFFHDYHVGIDLLNPGGEFHFVASQIPGKRGVRENLGPKGLSPGRKARVSVVTQYATTLQHTGRIYDVTYEAAPKQGSLVRVIVRDHMHALVQADAMPSLSLDNASLADVIKSVAAPFGFSSSTISIDTDASRSILTGKAVGGARLSAQAPVDLESYKVDQALPNAGESGFSFITRHARRFGLLVWGTPDGKLVVGRPNYTQKPLYEFVLKQGNKGVANNVKRGSRHLSFAQRPSEIHVYGKTFGGDFSRSHVHEVVYDEEVRAAGIYAPITVHDHNARDSAQARERGAYELGKRKQTSDVVQMTMRGHCGIDGAVYAIDTIGNVQFDSANVDAGMYLTKRTFTGGKASGRETTVMLVPKNSIVLGEGAR